MSPLLRARPLVLAISLIAFSLPAVGRVQETQGQGTVFFKTNIGSFKILGVGDIPAAGKVEISFTGTILINRASMSDPKISTTGNLRKEYDNAQHLQVAYHGTGNIVIDGHFTSIQWFGQNMSTKWQGFGIARLVGEFDKDLKTGEYWYVQNPDDVREWGTNLREITNPPRPGDYIEIAKPRVPQSNVTPPVAKPRKRG
jgi:hypothetical protein